MRTIHELAQAAKDAGWDNDPLAAEILSALRMANDAPAAPASHIAKPAWERTRILVSVGLLIVTISAIVPASLIDSKYRARLAVAESSEQDLRSRLKAAEASGVAAASSTKELIKAKDEAARLALQMSNEHSDVLAKENERLKQEIARLAAELASRAPKSGS